MSKPKKPISIKGLNKAQILGIGVHSTTLNQLLKAILSLSRQKAKITIVTPNPEFLVFSQKRPWFRKILNKADFSIPDGIGLVWASRFLAPNSPLQKRIPGVDLAAELLEIANQKKWRVGVIGARRGVSSERQQLISRLQKLYPNAKITALENNSSGNWNIIFACQGMGEQEKWIDKQVASTNAQIFMGCGGSLDYLTGFTKRAPNWMRKIGFEWFYRLLIQPWRLRRQLNLLKFLWLVLKTKRKG